MTAFLVLVVNAVMAVAVGCSFYVLRHLYFRVLTPAGLDASGKRIVI